MAVTLASFAACVLTVVGIYKYIIYPAFLSPLAKIPNAHPTSPILPVWILWNRFKQNGNRAIHASHMKHGPIVRLGPNELSVNCVEGGIKTIYAGSFEKHEWYPRQFFNYGVTNMFSMVHNKPHSVSKRMVSNVYSKSYIQTSSQVAANSKVLISTRLLPRLAEAVDRKAPIDVWSMNNGFTMDFMTAFQFGLANSTKWSLDDERRNHMLQGWTDRKAFEFYHSEIPRLAHALQAIGFRIFPSSMTETQLAFEDMNMKMCDASDQYLQSVDNVGNEPVVYKQMKAAMDKSVDKQNSKDAAAARLEIASEMLDHLGAGHETSAICLTYLHWEMCRHPEWQTKLRKELLSLATTITWPPPSRVDFDLPPSKVLDELPILHAILMETLRLHAPIPGNEPRITPANCTLAGYSGIPANVRVQAQPYSLHRNAEVFPDPETWSPERWLLPADSPKMREMLRWFWAFGSGGRMCIGSNLAVQEIKLVVAAIYTNFITTIVDDTGIEEMDAYTTRPKGSRLILQFAHAS